jgi:hypothetical protein
MWFLFAGWVVALVLWQCRLLLPVCHFVVMRSWSPADALLLLSLSLSLQKHRRVHPHAHLTTHTISLSFCVCVCVCVSTRRPTFGPSSTHTLSFSWNLLLVWFLFQLYYIVCSFLSLSLSLSLSLVVPFSGYLEKMDDATKQKTRLVLSKPFANLPVTKVCLLSFFILSISLSFLSLSLSFCLFLSLSLSFSLHSYTHMFTSLCALGCPSGGLVFLRLFSVHHCGNTTRIFHG